MNWRDPKRELPLDGQMVWVMLYPHKHRGTLRASAASIEIVHGEAEVSGSDCWVDNYDELGLGGICWDLAGERNKHCQMERGIAWLPMDEMPLPGWWK